MAIRNEFTLPNGTKLRVAGNNVRDTGVVLAAIGSRLQNLLERKLTGIDYVYEIPLGHLFEDEGNYNVASPVEKAQIVLTTLIGGRREGILTVFEKSGARCWICFAPHVETMSKLAVFFQRAGRKALYGKNCHCQVCQSIILEDHYKAHRLCENCVFVAVN